MEENFQRPRRSDFRQRAAAVREIPLERVLPRWGARQDRRDKSQWRTHRGPLSVTGSKFFNWHQEAGGGGAIDLVMHLGGWDADAAIQWLEDHFGGGPAIPLTAVNSSSPRSNSRRQAATPSRQPLRLPVAERANLSRVHRYLRKDRGLDPRILQTLIDAGKLYADRRGNAVFLMVTGKAQRPIGAELRGTGRQVWRGLAPGTCKNAGYFWIGPGDSQTEGRSPRIILCESAIDAISCFQLHVAQSAEPCICISTAGVRWDPPWLQPLLARGYDISCGFDNDQPGEDASRQMLTRHPSIQRLCPPLHDWNDTLLANH